MPPPVTRTDTLPGPAGVDLSLASSVIPVELFVRIMGHIAQIDRSLFGMNSHLDFSGAVNPQPDSVPLSTPSSPINSSASSADFPAVQLAEFA